MEGRICRCVISFMLNLWLYYIRFVCCLSCFFFFHAEYVIRVLVRSRVLGDVYMRRVVCCVCVVCVCVVCCVLCVVCCGCCVCVCVCVLSRIHI